MFQYEIHSLKSGKIFYRHIFVDKEYQITITRAELSREQLLVRNKRAKKKYNKFFNTQKTKKDNGKSIRID